MMSQTIAGRAERGAWMPRGRVAVSALFLLNGYVLGSWAPKIPLLKARLGIDEPTLGLMILAFGLGSLVMMPLVGGIIARDGSQRVVRIAGFLATIPLLLVTLAPGPGLAAAMLFLLGALVGGMDVAMNANAVSVERRMGRAIMSSCHGFWSLGGLIGAATGGVLIGVLGTLGHALVVCAAGLAAMALVWSRVAHDRPDAQTAAAPLRLPRSLLPWLLGVSALFCMIPEGAILDWSALYLQAELGASIETAGLAFAAFSATMAVLRFTGDPLRDRLGAVRTLRLSILLAAAGMVLGGLAPGPGWAVAGFAVAGLGIANMVPIMFSAAGNLPGFAPGIALSLVTFMGYSGMLFAPTLIGFVAAYTGLAAIYLALPVLFLAVLALSHHGRHADLADR